MSRFRTLLLFPQTWGLGSLLLASALFTPAPARAQTFYTVTDLNPTSNYGSVGRGISGGTQVGSAGFGDPGNGTAVLWKGTPGSVVRLEVAGLDTSVAYGVSGNSQVGYAISSTDPNHRTHAILWHGTADSAIDLSPPGSSPSYANGVSGNSQVGVGNDHALLWHGTADSAIDLNPSDYAFSEAFGVDGDAQVGYGESNASGINHALLWHGTAASAVDLNPAGFHASYANAVSGDAQVGTGFIIDANGNQFVHGVLWHGTAASAVDLNPPGATVSEVQGVSGNTQVGYAGFPGTMFAQAVVWNGTAASAVNLNKFLPADYNSGSVAYGVDSKGNIIGYGFNTSGGAHAFIWHAASAPAKPTVLHLYPASRTEGREGFTLTVSGTNFTPASTVEWDDMVQPTTYVNSTTLTASISSFLIDTAGRSVVDVSTPGAGTSNYHIETIMPRPTLTNLSPASKAAGSGAFTLTVTGTGFRPASFYSPTVVKWNGTELATTYVSDTKLTAQVPASLIETAGTAQVVVTTPQVATSEARSFTVTP